MKILMCRTTVLILLAVVVSGCNLSDKSDKPNKKLYRDGVEVPILETLKPNETYKLDNKYSWGTISSYEFKKGVVCFVYRSPSADILFQCLKS